MFDIYHKMTEEEERLTQELFDAKNELKLLIDAKYIYQKDMEMIAEDQTGNKWGLVLLLFIACFFWLFFFLDILVGFVFQTAPLTMAIIAASGTPVCAIVSTIFFVKYHTNYLLVHSKKEKYMKKAKKENIQNREAYRLDIIRKYTDVSDKLLEADARVRMLQNELEEMELKSSTNG